jgi:hypothetical protein
MAEAKISQLAKLLSAVMECEDVPVDIHNATADWSCPSTYRVTNSPELFQMILDDTKAHPEDYGEVPKVSHPVRRAEGPKLVLAEKETPQGQPEAAVLTLGQHRSAVLNSRPSIWSLHQNLGLSGRYPYTRFNGHTRLPRQAAEGRSGKGAGNSEGVELNFEESGLRPAFSIFQEAKPAAGLELECS